MSIPVDLGELGRAITERGPRALLVSVSAEGRAHVVSIEVTETDDTLTMAVGTRTRANVATGPDVTIVWPAAPNGAHHLIVDGTAHPPSDDGLLVVQPTTAVLHRV